MNTAIRSHSPHTIPHPFPYQGSKRLLAPMIVECLPRDTRRLVEPFAGSAAVSVAAGWTGRASEFILNDAHKPLASLWDQIVSNASNLADAYEELWNAQLNDSRHFYDQIRIRFNREHRPADFLYLLARCVKAAIRYNRYGEFNNSPDKRRLGMRPEEMRRGLLLVSEIFNGRTIVTAQDYREILHECGKYDVVYMDPPYQGVCDRHDSRYARGVRFQEFVGELEELNRRGIAYIVSYDGRTGDRRYGQILPDSLHLKHFEVAAGRSTQATLLGRKHHTYESLYLSPVLSVRLDGARLRLMQEAEASLFE